MDVRLKNIGRAFVIVFLLAFVTGDMSGAGNNPALAQGTSADPGVVPPGTDAETWRLIRRGARGTVSLPQRDAGYMVVSSGQSWRSWRNGPVSMLGVVLILGTLVTLAAFYFIRGPIKIDAGLSGRLVERFNNLERFAHWLTATSFIVLGLTGLNMMYGRYIIKPVIGPDAFSAITAAGKYAHNFIGFAFMVGLVLIVWLWVRDNKPERLDMEWLKSGGGLFKRGVHPPAKRFNAGQKIMFWLVVLTGISLSFSGLVLLFPMTFAPIGWLVSVFGAIGIGSGEMNLLQEIQFTQLWHAFLALVMIAVILAHIYIGWLGMEGAYDAVGTGFVDENWAREHHSLWTPETRAEASSQPAASSGGGAAGAAAAPLSAPSDK